VTARRGLALTARAFSAALLLAGLAAACGGSSGRAAPAAPAAPTPTTAVGLESDGSGACAILYHRDVKCWGLNNFGQLGDDSDTPSKVPVSVNGLTGVLSLVGESSQGGYCAVLLSGGVDCWGTNTSGALGNGSTTLTQADVPVAVTGVTDATNGGTNNAYTYCMLLSSESVRCWGDNTDGQLGDGNAAPSSNVPVGVLGVFKPVGLASDGTSFCAQLKSGGAQCWGSNTDGALGNGSTAPSSSVPVTVQGLDYVQKLFGRVGGYCAVIDGGGVKCWGSNADGSLADGQASGYSAVPVAVKGLSGVSSIDGTCAVLGSGKVDCWGSGIDGELGNGTSGQPSDVPVPVKGLTGVSQLAGNYCALLESGGVKCWGSNDNDGALGNGSKKAFSDVAVTVKGITGATRLVYDAAGGGGYCALLGASGRVECWGDNHDGELGDGAKEPSSAVPVRVSGLGS
jgi:alpha-tubulin suppressor-like RCC1 family protein